MSQQFIVTTEHADMDIQRIHAFLVQSYWARNIPLDVLTKALRNSLCFGVLERQFGQVAFARLITDKATFAYLADVFVLPEFRNQGLSKMMMQEVVAHPELQGLRRIMLATSDAHGLYQQFGFQPLNDPALFMQLWNPNVYSD